MKFPRKIKDAAPANHDRASIEKVAAIAAEKFGYRVGEDPAEVVRRLGVRITHTTPVSEHADELVIFPDGTGELSLIDNSLNVDGRTQRNREAWDAAKAIGHILLHLPGVIEKDRETAMVVERYPKDDSGQKAAQEATWFATAFLAPASKVLELAAKGVNHGDIAQTLMERNFLSRQLARIRVRSILGEECGEAKDVEVLDA